MVFSHKLIKKLYTLPMIFFKFMLLELLNIIVGDFHIFRSLFKIWKMIFPSPPKKRTKKAQKKRASMVTKVEYLDSIAIN
jgi:hypothetical protein